MWEAIKVILSIPGVWFIIVIGIITFIGCTISDSKMDEKAEKERRRSYRGGIHYLRVQDENGKWKNIPDPDFYTEKYMSGLNISERLDIRSPGRYDSHFEHNPMARPGDCCICGARAVVPTMDSPYHGLCEKCSQEYLKSKFCTQEFTDKGYDGIGKLALWIYQRGLAKDVRDHVITEEQARADMQEVYKYVLGCCERRRNEETAEQRAAREKREREAAEEELLNLANRIG